MDYKIIIAESLNKYLNMGVEEIYKIIQVPSNFKNGEFTFPCFILSKILKESPDKISLELKEKIGFIDYFEKIEANGPYLNFYIDKTQYAQFIIKKIISKEEVVIKNKFEDEKIVVIDSSVSFFENSMFNLYSILINNSLKNMLEYKGYKVVSELSLDISNDVIARILYAYDKWGIEEQLKKDPMKEIYRLYTKFFDQLSKNEDLERKAKEKYNLLYKGDIKINSCWNLLKELALNQFKATLKLMNIEFDLYNIEYIYNKYSNEIIKELKKNELVFKFLENEVCILKEDNLPPCIIKNSCGELGSTIKTIDRMLYSKRFYDFYKYIYILKKDDMIQFNQLKQVCKKLNFLWVDDIYLVFIGLGNLNNYTFEGSNNRIWIASLLNEIIKKSERIKINKDVNLNNQIDLLKEISINSLKFSFLKNNPETNIIVSLESILSLDNNAGIKIQLLYIRGLSILQKYENMIKEIDDFSIVTKENYLLIKELGNYEDVITDAMEKLDPSIIVNYLESLSLKIEFFYNNDCFSKSDNNSKLAFQLKVAKGTVIVINKCLNAIGISTEKIEEN
ncbi:MAG: arginine--tRNA ligase [Clostridium sp.]|nr:arginine--tRNA ligase [Clostridium sp.]